MARRGLQQREADLRAKGQPANQMRDLAIAHLLAKGSSLHVDEGARAFLQ